MSSITIRNLDPALKERLRVRAAERGRSMEAEARRILQTALEPSSRPPARNLYARIHDRFAALGGVELDAPPRDHVRNAGPVAKFKNRSIGLAISRLSLL